MTTTLTTAAQEESTYIITLAFEDEDGTAVTPNSITWSLVDSGDSYINSRQDVSVGSPASSVDIVLYGDDLAFQTGESGDAVRILVVEAEYDSDAGSGLPLKDQAVFIIEDLNKVT